MLTQNFSVALLTCVLMGAASISVAADKPAKSAPTASAPSAASSAKADAGPPLLTRDQLRACRAQQARISQLRDDLDKEQASVEALKADVDQRGEQLKQKLDSVDRSKQAAIDEYNEEIKARQKLVDDFDARVTTFNGHVESARGESDAYVKDCKDRRFLDSDAKALDAGK